MEVGVTEHLNDAIPQDLQFVDSKGLPVTLAEYFDGELPVVLTLNYSSCPMLCSLQLDGLFDGLKKMKWDMGDKYRMVTVSIDPKESPDRAQMTRKKYLQHYGRRFRRRLCLPGGQERADHAISRHGWVSLPLRAQDRGIRAYGRDHDLHTRWPSLPLPIRRRV